MAPPNKGSEHKHSLVTRGFLGGQERAHNDWHRTDTGDSRPLMACSSCKEGHVAVTKVYTELLVASFPGIERSPPNVSPLATGDKKLQIILVCRPPFGSLIAG